MPTVKFVKEKKEIEVPLGANLRDEAQNAGINLNQGLNGIGASANYWVNCGGKGLCGSCRVLITDGMDHVTPMTTTEHMTFHRPIPDPIPPLAFIGNEQKMRLACCVYVNGDIAVETGPPLNLFGENFFS
jgi:ferredoxin